MSGAPDKMVADLEQAGQTCVVYFDNDKAYLGFADMASGIYEGTHHTLHVTSRCGNPGKVGTLLPILRL
jgi:prophage tail gpP-like protein